MAHRGIHFLHILDTAIAGTLEYQQSTSGFFSGIIKHHLDDKRGMLAYETPRWIDWLAWWWTIFGITFLPFNPPEWFFVEYMRYDLLSCLSTTMIWNGLCLKFLCSSLLCRVKYKPLTNIMCVDLLESLRFRYTVVIHYLTINKISSGFQAFWV